MRRWGRRWRIRDAMKGREKGKGGCMVIRGGEAEADGQSSAGEAGHLKGNEPVRGASGPDARQTAGIEIINAEDDSIKRSPIWLRVYNTPLPLPHAPTSSSWPPTTSVLPPPSPPTLTTSSTQPTSRPPSTHPSPPSMSTEKAMFMIQTIGPSPSTLVLHPHLHTLVPAGNFALALFSTRAQYLTKMTTRRTQMPTSCLPTTHTRA